MRKIRVTLRTKPIKNNKESIRFDCAPPITNPVTGKTTRWIYTGLFLYTKPRTALERTHNSETKALAENQRAQRQLELQAEQYGFLTEKELKTDLFDFFEELTNKKEGSTADVWKCALNHLKNYFGEKKKLSALTLAECEGFRDYLLKKAKKLQVKKGVLKEEADPISQNTASMYFSKFKTALRKAYRSDLITTDLNSRLETIPTLETERQFLSLEELQLLVKTECQRPVVKKAALFSALTGLRHSDIQKLTWGEVQYNNTGGHFLRFRQKKTQGTELLPINELAIPLLGERGEPENKVFKLDYSAYNNDLLNAWVKAAGINRHITFHSFRHTFATLQLSLGTDILTVSKLLGHRELKTTQIYAKVMDKAKQEAANKIKLEF